MLDDATTVREGEELELERLEAYIRDRILDAVGPLSVEQFPSGYSNLTYLLRFGSREFVLRRPPFGNQVKTAHDMGREYHVLSNLCDVYDQAPRPLLFCDDMSVIGDEFYVMERRRGVILRGAKAPEPFASHPESMRALCESFVRGLATLHCLDYGTAGLGDLGRPEGYVERQVAGWTKRFQAARTDDHPQIDDLAGWLSENMPPERSPALIHNDYKYDNLMLDPDNLTKIVAVLDWEMATVGDPLMDLGTALAYWVEPGDPEPQRARAFGPTMAPGSYSRQELVEQYIRFTDFEISDPLFYYCYGLFKLAGIVQQIYARYVRGATKDPRFAELKHTVASLGSMGWSAINAGRI